MIAFILRIIVNALGLAAAAWIVPGIKVTPAPVDNPDLGLVLSYLTVGLIFGLVNALVRPIIKILALPITCLTLGLFAIVINAAMLMLTSWITDHLSYGLHVDSFFWDAILASLIISLVSAVIGFFTPSRR
ncbi:hypothetical protein CQ018_06465 [Arthrobacter sp. MYb227]|uniref:phage holin family protein n=1 Tax=Arthrobacter sp. MYb227 TaxID=1848601 RepID=UPI000CFB3F0C|nr:phage holin family protein [Arthrobacter sp. MYb227]PQZ94976.1 hypothetical protein CQ018_06465 [Arthrobacter sp. MYb227]